MISLSQICKQIVTDSIDHDYIASVCCGQEDLRSIYHSEYGYHGVTPKTCKDYLQGLPSVCTVPFSNHEILELLEENGIEISLDDEGYQDDDKAYDLIEAYWLECGKAFYNMIR